VRSSFTWSRSLAPSVETSRLLLMEHWREVKRQTEPAHSPDAAQREATNNKLLCAGKAQLLPSSRSAARFVPTVEPLRYDALQPVLAGDGDHLLGRNAERLRKLDQIGGAQGIAEELLTLDQGSMRKSRPASMSRSKAKKTTGAPLLAEFWISWKLGTPRLSSATSSPSMIEPVGTAVASARYVSRN
jgi:hypothetical protein